MIIPIAYETYQLIADSFSNLTPNKDYNAFIDRPAILSLINNIDGQNILDAGCGPGIYAEIQINKKANVTGIDLSENMIKNAKSRNGNKAKFIIGNLEEPLHYLNDNEFDGILSALAISYVENLLKLFSEFNRILKPNGWFVFSTEHPFFSYQFFKLENYYEVQKVKCKWKGFTEIPIEMNSYYHSLGYICESLSSNGFIIEKILEPKPIKEFQEHDPKDYDKRIKFPSFIHFRAIKKS